MNREPTKGRNWAPRSHFSTPFAETGTKVVANGRYIVRQEYERLRMLQFASQSLEAEPPRTAPVLPRRQCNAEEAMHTCVHESTVCAMGVHGLWDTGDGRFMQLAGSRRDLQQAKPREARL